MPNPFASPTVTRAIHLMLVAIIGMAFVGLAVGIRQGATTSQPELPPRLTPLPHPEAVPATPYSDFDRRLHGANSKWTNSLATLKQPPLPRSRAMAAGSEDDQPESGDAERQVALVGRAARRAFDGGPPVVPHPIDQMSVASCVVCHGPGLYIGKGVRAPQMSHPFMANCTQCHVESQSPDHEPLMLAENSFEGLPAPVRGHRAWDQAPPTLPHPVFMRENCLSCHGPAGAEPIRTRHPWRAECLQCHAPSAELDQFARLRPNGE